MDRFGSSRFMAVAFVLVALLACGHRASAQDTRTVTQPTIPPSCTVLTAEKTDHAEILPPSQERSTDTTRIQKALDGCKPGHSVELALGGVKDGAPRNAFLSGSLDLRTGVTLLIDKGVTLYGSRNPKDYDPDPAAGGKLLCGTLSPFSTSYDPSTTYYVDKGIKLPGRPCKPLISAIDVKNAAVMGGGIVDGRGGATIVGHDYSWWQMARRAEPKQLAYYSALLIVADHADGFTLYGITLHNAPNYNVFVNDTDGFTVWGIHLLTPTVKGTDARNTDGIDPRSSTNVTIAKSWIEDGDDNISTKTGVTHMSVLDNHFYNGHGMSIGSEIVTGDSSILVDGLTEDRTTSGIRIKSNDARGGLVQNLVFRNICMRDVLVPIAISPFYNNTTVEGFTDPGIKGDHIPEFKNITLKNVIATTPGDVLIAGKDAGHITEVTLDGVVVKGIKPGQVHSQFSHITVTGRGTALHFSGKGVVVVGQKAASGRGLDADVRACAKKFLPMQ